MIKNLKEYYGLFGRWAAMSFSPEEDARVEKELERFRRENADLLKEVHERALDVIIVQDPKTKKYYMENAHRDEALPEI